MLPWVSSALRRLGVLAGGRPASELLLWRRVGRHPAAGARSKHWAVAAGRIGVSVPSSTLSLLSRDRPQTNSGCLRRPRRSFRGR